MMTQSSFGSHSLRRLSLCAFLALIGLSTAVERHKVGIVVGHDAKMVRREPRTSDRLADSPPESLIQAQGLAQEDHADLQPLSGDYGGYPAPDGPPRDGGYPSPDGRYGPADPYGRDGPADPYGPVTSYPGALQPFADGPMRAASPHAQGNMLGPMNEMEARQEVQKMDRIISEAEFRAGLPDTTRTTPPPDPGPDIIEEEERTGMYVACLIVLVLGALAAGYSLHKFQGQKAGIDATEESAEARAQEEDEQTPAGIATQS